MPIQSITVTSDTLKRIVIILTIYSSLIALYIGILAASIAATSDEKFIKNNISISVYESWNKQQTAMTTQTTSNTKQSGWRPPVFFSDKKC